LQGICPSNWHLPSGGLTAEDSEFINLEVILGGTGGDRSNNTAQYIKFWHNETGGWKHISTGIIASLNNNGWGNIFHSRLSGNDRRARWWVAGIAEQRKITFVRIYDTFYGFNYAADMKWDGETVRCIKD
jgi:uncharacterized protein (TIGR02145 family)